MQISIKISTARIPTKVQTQSTAAVVATRPGAQLVRRAARHLRHVPNYIRNNNITKINKWQNSEKKTVQWQKNNGKSETNITNTKSNISNDVILSITRHNDLSTNSLLIYFNRATTINITKIAYTKISVP